MRRLILLRHAQAQASSPGGDVERALTPRGREDARRAGERLAELGVHIDLALVSPARRAEETWAEASAASPAARLEQPASLYDAHPREMLALAEAAGEETVLVVAHNPGLHTLALRLTEAGGAPAPMRATLRRGLPPAGLVLFSRDGEGRFAGEQILLPELTA